MVGDAQEEGLGEVAFGEEGSTQWTLATEVETAVGVGREADDEPKDHLPDFVGDPSTQGSVCPDGSSHFEHTVEIVAVLGGELVV